MKSVLPKVLHPIAGQSMVGHLINRLSAIETERIVAVTSPDLREEIEIFSSIEIAIQEPPLGTAHAEDSQLVETRPADTGAVLGRGNGIAHCLSAD